MQKISMWQQIPLQHFPQKIITGLV